MKRYKILPDQLLLLDELLQSMQFSFYFNKFDQLSIGYDVRKERLSKDNYDHFASEARLAVYIAVAMGNVPEDTWGNLLRPYNKGGSLLSWGGTIFEYILPQLFLKTHPDSLGYRSFQTLLSSNLQFSGKFHLPWGFSESLYVDEVSKSYEYKAIGVSALSRDPLQVQIRTVAPYATSLMCVIDTRKAIKNFSSLEDLNLLTEYGFYEAITFSKTAQPLLIDSYMAHHQGMILASLTNALTANMLVSLFNSYATMDTVDYLLDEDIPNYPDITDMKALKFSLRDE
jgi:cyclic beta-1,2-glucan synthetase